MNNQKTGKKTHSSEPYSHPLIKTLEDACAEDHSKIMPTYQPIVPSHRNRTSSKLMRFTTLMPSCNSTFTAFLHPFHPLTSELPQLTRVVQCPHCFSIANPLSKIQNYSTLTCNLCGATSTILPYESTEYQESYAYQYDCQSSAKKESKVDGSCSQNAVRRVCLVIEASQYNFEKKVHKGIISCLSALANADFQLALIFFDSEFVYFLDQEILEVTKVTLQKSQEDALVDWDCLPLSEDNLFRHICHFDESVAQVIEAIMYEAFYIKETVLSEVTSLLQRQLPKTCEIKLFITTLNHPQQQQQTHTKGASLISKIFKDKKNCPPDRKGKTTPEENHQQALTLSENMQFFVMVQNTTYQQTIDVLSYHVARAYGLTESKLQSNLYYDLFENIELKQLVNVQIMVKASYCLELLEPEFPAYDLYGRIKITEISHHRSFRTYKLCISQCNQTTMIPLKFKVNNVSPCEKPCFQVTYLHQIEQQQKGIVINGAPLQVITGMSLEFLDDESLFNDHFRKALSMWRGSNFKDLKGSLQGQCEQLVRFLKSNFKYNAINFPKSLKHYFLYIFALLEKMKKGTLNCYSLYRLANCGLETFSKQLYFRTYRLESAELRNIRSCHSVLEKYGIVFMENGEELFMVFCDTAVSDIKEVFGHYDTLPSLALKHYELPELPTNHRYRNAIEAIRSSNAQSFLRLKIVDQDSSFFECFIHPALYDKKEHIEFLQKTWKNA